MIGLNTLGLDVAASTIMENDNEEFVVQATEAVVVYMNGARPDFIIDLVTHRFASIGDTVDGDGLSILCQCGVITTVYLVDVPEGDTLLNMAYTAFAEHQVSQFGGMI